MLQLIAENQNFHSILETFSSRAYGWIELNWIELTYVIMLLLSGTLCCITVDPFNFSTLRGKIYKPNCLTSSIVNKCECCSFKCFCFVLLLVICGTKWLTFHADVPLRKYVFTPVWCVCNTWCNMWLTDCTDLQQQQQHKSEDDISDVEMQAMAGMSEEEKARARAAHKRRLGSWLLPCTQRALLHYTLRIQL